MEMETTELEGLSMAVTGIDRMPEADQTIFAVLLADYTRDFHSDTNLQTSVTVEQVVTNPTRRGLRSLQEDSVTVFYTQTISTDGTVDALGLVQEPFATEAGQDAFTTILQDSSQGVLADVQGVSAVEAPTEAPTVSPDVVTQRPTAASDDDDDDGLSLGAIIGIAVGGSVVLLGLLYLLCCRNSDSQSVKDPPPSVNVRPGGDEVSTLAPPHVSNNGGPSAESLAGGYGDQR